MGTSVRRTPHLLHHLERLREVIHGDRVRDDVERVVIVRQLRVIVEVFDDVVAQDGVLLELVLLLIERRGELKGVRSGVERRRGRGLKARAGRRDTPGEVLKDRRSSRERGRMGTSV
jgi:hypothetical protein